MTLLRVTKWKKWMYWCSQARAWQFARRLMTSLMRLSKYFGQTTGIICHNYHPLLKWCSVVWHIMTVSTKLNQLTNLKTKTLLQSYAHAPKTKTEQQRKTFYFIIKALHFAFRKASLINDIVIIKAQRTTRRQDGKSVTTSLLGSSSRSKWRRAEAPGQGCRNTLRNVVILSQDDICSRHVTNLKYSTFLGIFREPGPGLSAPPPWMWRRPWRGGWLNTALSTTNNSLGSWQVGYINWSRCNVTWYASRPKSNSTQHCRIAHERQSFRCKPNLVPRARTFQVGGDRTLPWCWPKGTRPLEMRLLQTIPEWLTWVFIQWFVPKSFFKLPIIMLLKSDISIVFFMIGFTIWLVLLQFSFLLSFIDSSIQHYIIIITFYRSLYHYFFNVSISVLF